jgi:glycosyltransferase involved in cell wall biosynthesis
MPKISVIVPIYNSEKYLSRCLDSIIAQKFYDYECILVDDCSNDNSLEICKKYSFFDKRITVYHKEKNEGTAQARKTGIDIASAEYILFLDNDDWIEPEMLEELYIKAISQNYDMVYCDYYNDINTKSIYCYLPPPIGNIYKYI